VPAAEQAAWKTYAKGGDFARYYSDLELVVLWKREGAEIKERARREYGSESRTIKNQETYLRPGLTYTLVTVSGFSCRVLPADAIYDMTGPAIFLADDSKDWHNHYIVLGLLNSSVTQYLLRVITDSRHWHVFALQRVPFLLPSSSEATEVGLSAKLSCSAKQRLQALIEPSSLFVAPWEGAPLHNLQSTFTELNRNVAFAAERLSESQAAIDHSLAKLVHTSVEVFIDAQLTIEQAVFGGLEVAQWQDQEVFVSAMLSYVLGIAFGRWDVRLVTAELKAPELPDPFSPLPACPPGLLQNERRLPLTQFEVERRQAAGEWHYPLEIPWDGILVDDEDHPNDIVRRVRDALAVIWKDHAEAIEQEGCEILGVKDLREYFRKPSLFFADHLKRYCKSRRQAPIYWPLSSASGSYTLWIYYHRLNDDLLYTVLNKYVMPKIDTTEKGLRRIESELSNAIGREASALRTAFERTTSLLEELREFRDDLARVAELPYKPNLNDGVLITASPLCNLFRLPKWRKDVQECWNRLETGEYDWAQLAYSIWPERVREVCKNDRSIAIAHSLEEQCEVASKPAKKKRAKKVAIEETVPGDEE
jgi:hypothetical protein